MSGCNHLRLDPTDYHRLLHGSDEKKGYFKVVNSNDGLDWATYYKSKEAYEEHCSSMQARSAKRPEC